MSDELRATQIDRDHWFTMWETARAELAAAAVARAEKAEAERDAMRAQWGEDVFRAYQEGFNSSLGYSGEDGMADAWEVSDAKARIDALKGDGDE